MKGRSVGCRVGRRGRAWLRTVADAISNAGAVIRKRAVLRRRRRPGRPWRRRRRETAVRAAGGDRPQLLRRRRRADLEAAKSDRAVRAPGDRLTRAHMHVERAVACAAILRGADRDIVAASLHLVLIRRDINVGNRAHDAPLVVAVVVDAVREARTTRLDLAVLATRDDRPQVARRDGWARRVRRARRRRRVWRRRTGRRRRRSGYRRGRGHHRRRATDRESVPRHRCVRPPMDQLSSAHEHIPRPVGGAPIRDAIDRDVVAARLDIVHCGVRVQLLVRDGGAALVVCVGGGAVGDAVPLHYVVLAAIQLGEGWAGGGGGECVSRGRGRRRGERRGKVGGVCVYVGRASSSSAPNNSPG